MNRLKNLATAIRSSKPGAIAATLVALIPVVTLIVSAARLTKRKSAPKKSVAPVLPDAVRPIVLNKVVAADVGDTTDADTADTTTLEVVVPVDTADEGPVALTAPPESLRPPGPFTWLASALLAAAVLAGAIVIVLYINSYKNDAPEQADTNSHVKVAEYDEFVPYERTATGKSVASIKVTDATNVTNEVEGVAPNATVIDVNVAVKNDTTESVEVPSPAMNVYLHKPGSGLMTSGTVHKAHDDKPRFGFDVHLKPGHTKKYTVRIETREKLGNFGIVVASNTGTDDNLYTFKFPKS